MEPQDSKNTQNIDDEIKILREKKQKLEKISSQIKNIQEKKPDEKSPPIYSEKHHKQKSRVEPEKHHKQKSRVEPEKLVLTKQEILDFCDHVLEKWEKDTSKDTRHIFAMNAVKTSILWTEEDTIKEIWNEIIHWMFELLYKNAIAQEDSENLEWSKIMQKLGDRVSSLKTGQSL